MICKKIDIIKLLKEYCINYKMQQEQLNNTTKKIYFKWVRTINTLYLPIDSQWSLDEFIQYVKNKIFKIKQGTIIRSYYALSTFSQKFTFLKSELYLFVINFI